MQENKYVQLHVSVIMMKMSDIVSMHLSHTLRSNEIINDCCKSCCQ